MEPTHSPQKSIVLVIIVAILCAIIGGFMLGQSSRSVIDNDSSTSEDDQNPVPPSPNPAPTPSLAPSPTPNPNPVPLPDPTVYTIDQLINNNNLANVNCGETRSATGKTFTITGYLYSGDATYLRNSSRFNLRSSKNLANTPMDITVVANVSSIIDAINAAFTATNNDWVRLRVTGVLRGHDLPAMNACYIGYGLDTGSITVI